MNKNFVTNPNKLSQPAGAALALLGVKGMIPLWHGVQGCTAFAKVLFISHFREPMPFQNTAISQTNIIMGGDQNIKEALNNLSNEAEIVGLITTGVAETSGIDLKSVFMEIEKSNPNKHLLYINTPDYEGNLSSGYTKATAQLLRSFVSKTTKKNPKQVAIFPGPFFTPGEIEELRDIITDFGLEPLFCPDQGDSLFGYLKKQQFSPCSCGGISVNQIEKLSESALVISIGASMESLAQKFSEVHSIPVLHYSSLAILDEIDHLFETLEWISGESTPKKYRKQREHYMDVLLDTDYTFHGKKAAIAGDEEFVKRWKDPLNMLEIETVGVANQPISSMNEEDLIDLSEKLESHKVDFIIGNTHVAQLASDLQIPVIRSGIPVSDRFGEPQSVRVGYLGAAKQLMECGNAILENSHSYSPYISKLTETLI